MNKKRNVIRWIMLLGWMGIIFFMSHQSADVSNSQSEFVIRIFEFLGIRLDSYFGSMATLVIRKSAHFAEYAILFLLLYRVLCLYIDKRKAKLYTLLGVFIYAGLDEIHQYFIPGRAMAFNDVIIDTTGGVMSMIIITIFEKIKQIKKWNIYN